MVRRLRAMHQHPLPISPRRPKSRSFCLSRYRCKRSAATSPIFGISPSNAPALVHSEVVYTGNNNDTAELKAHHIDEKIEKQIRKDFAKAGKLPKLLIVTEKLLTGYDAPFLYAMYLDKPMRDHTLLQAIARVSRPIGSEQIERANVPASDQAGARRAVRS